MKSRRDLMRLAGPVGLAAALPAIGGGQALAREAGSAADCGLADLYQRELGFLAPMSSPASDPTVAGGASRHEEVAKAFRLLYDAPRGGSAWDVACYFRDLTDQNETGDPYNWEWKTRANPLIVGFFGLTQALPDRGDRTHWCAAFVSFCLYASNHVSARTASALGYRKYNGPRVEDPKIGDIVVFQRLGLEYKTNGHVGFFAGWEKNGKGQPTGRLLVLGGNQGGKRYGGSDDGKGGGAVIVSPWAVKSAGYELIGFRRPVALKDA